MILSLQLKNFKSIGQNPVSLDLKPLSIISGANSSGKSTLIQSILLIMQTMANHENVALQLNGELVTLGLVNDVWHQGELPTSTSELLSIQMIIRDLNDEKNLFLKVDFAPLDKDPNQVQVINAIYAIGDDINQYNEHLEIQKDNDSDDYYVVNISNELDEYIHGELKSRGFTEINESFINTKIKLEDFYPRAIWIAGQTRSKQLDWATALSNPIDIPDYILQERIPSEHWEILIKGAAELKLPDLRSWWEVNAPKTLSEYRKWYGKLSVNKAQSFQNYLMQKLEGVVVPNNSWEHNISFFERIEHNLSELFMRKIRYLSANRLAPTMLFTPKVNPFGSEVGTTGSNLAIAIRDYGNKQITFWNPIAQKSEEVILIESLMIWLQYFELIERVVAEDQGKLGTLLKVYTAGLDKELDLTSVGFGTSQILPIIVQGLLTPLNGLFIIEQPEVHLHPRVQSQLADFFLALAMVGVQCIIETHSEHIINRVRLRIVEDENTEILKQVGIYFVEKQDGESHFINVEPNEYGAILRWPEGFFDQEENENLLIARLASKKRKAKAT